MTPTPQVDQILAGWPSTLDTIGDARKMKDMVDFARSLERQLAEANNCYQILAEEFRDFKRRNGIFGDGA